MEIIGEFLLQVVCLFPGAFVIWLFKRKRKTFKEVIKEDYNRSVAVGLGILMLILTTVALLVVNN